MYMYICIERERDTHISLCVRVAFGRPQARLRGRLSGRGQSGARDALVHARTVPRDVMVLSIPLVAWLGYVLCMSCCLLLPCSCVILCDCMCLVVVVRY